MFKIDPQDLSGVAETVLIPLYIRAMESQRADALIKDEKAVELIAQMSLDFSRVKRIPLSEANKLMIILRNRKFDRCAEDFLARQPDTVVVHIGCGFDSRFERVDNGQVDWYDLDFSDVIELRRKFIGGGKERYHLLGCSVLEDTWLEAVSARRPRPFLFMAEGVSMHLTEEQNKLLVLTPRDRFPGAELVFDAYSPVHLWVTTSRPPGPASVVTGGSGTARRSRVGAQASTCSVSGGTSMTQRRGWITFDGFAPLKPCSGRCASTTSNLKRRQGENSLYIQVKRRLTCQKQPTKI